MALKQAEKLELFNAFVNHMTGKDEGGMSLFAYVNGGKESLEEFFKTPEYPGEKEKDFIPELAQRLAATREFPKENISYIEIGTGPHAEKFIALAEAFNEKTASFKWLKGVTNRFVEVIGNDIVKNYTDSWAAEVKDAFNMNARTITSKFEDINTPIKTKGVPVVFGWNAPIWNAPSKLSGLEHEFILANALKKLGRLAGSGGYVVLSHYPVVDPNKIEALYNNPNCVAAVKSILSLIEEELKPVCKDTNSNTLVPFTSLFDIDIYYDHKSGHIKMDVVSTRDSSLAMDDAMFAKKLKKGERFTFVDSAKVSQKMMNDLVQMTNMFEIITTAHNREGDVLATALRVRGP